MEFLFQARLKSKDLRLHQKYASLQVFSKILLIFVAIYNEFLDILGTLSYQNTFYQRLLTVTRFSKYSFPKIQYIFRTGYYGLRKLKMLNVSNENLIELEWQNIDVISNIKFTSNIYRSSLFYIQQRRIQNPIKRLRQRFSSKQLTAFTR